MDGKVNENKIYSDTSQSISIHDLTEEQKSALQRQDSRTVSTFRSEKFDKEAKKHWDIFYKRNENRFFKDRHWTTREFWELCGDSEENEVTPKRILTEIGCGVGNFAFPLLEDVNCNLFIYACDFSPRAVDIVKSNELYDEENIAAFVCDISSKDAFASSPVEHETSDFASLMFVLSAIAPEHFENAIDNAAYILKKSKGLLIFRDYAVNDMAMFRFGPNTKVGKRRYVRQDGTMTYFFEKEEIERLMNKCGFQTVTLEYVERRTINKKEGIDVPRLFIQGKFRKL